MKLLTSCSPILKQNIRPFDTIIRIVFYLLFANLHVLFLIVTLWSPCHSNWVCNFSMQNCHAISRCCGAWWSLFNRIYKAGKTNSRQKLNSCFTQEKGAKSYSFPRSCQTYNGLITILWLPIIINFHSIFYTIHFKAISLMNNFLFIL